jgi:hypothetical protein
MQDGKLNKASHTMPAETAISDSLSTFSKDLFKGKVLFCTGGQSFAFSRRASLTPAQVEVGSATK